MPDAVAAASVQYQFCSKETTPSGNILTENMQTKRIGICV